MNLPDYIYESVDFLRKKKIPKTIEAAVILGSGLGSFVDHIRNQIRIPYALLPGFPSPSVKGHEGALIAGSVNSKNIIAFSGRFHHYEGFSFEQTTLPIYLGKALGVNKLIISNAAGAINTDFNVGDLMIISSIIRQNMMISPTGNARHRCNLYPAVDEVRNIAAESGLPVRNGTYIYAKGPNYETKAEIRAFRQMGADAVGMSTAPELFEAARLSLKSIAVSLISNMAAGVTNQKLHHTEVEKAAESRKNDFARLIKKLIKEL